MRSDLYLEKGSPFKPGRNAADAVTDRGRIVVHWDAAAGGLTAKFAEPVEVSQVRIDTTVPMGIEQKCDWRIDYGLLALSDGRRRTVKADELGGRPIDLGPGKASWIRFESWTGNVVGRRPDGTISRADRARGAKPIPNATCLSLEALGPAP